ncbi:Crinkler (CRN) [Phytophthora megakarya]|uniref:Crinkler (CRN) n=1 Tax=Phytophthora megakarya TaxID=4795 RepID=A0A225UXD5_9STRA|nr:Crinkler (CRN) [Phytophthora megakarya]
MLKLFCVVIGPAGSAFPVNIDESYSINDLKKTIKKKIPNMFRDVLSLAKKDGAWLTGNNVKKGLRDTSCLTPVDVARAMLQMVGVSEQLLGKAVPEVNAAGYGPVHVLVVVP